MKTQVAAKRSRMSLSLQIAELLKKSPLQTPDALTVAQLLLDVIEDEQNNISDDGMATLCGLAGMFCRDGVDAAMPQHTRVDAQGEPVYTEQEMTKAFGGTPEQVRAYVDQAQKAALAEGKSLLVPMQDTSPLQ